MKRRDFLALSTAAGALALAAHPALANVPTSFDPTLSPPMDDRQKFIDWMVKYRGEDPTFLAQRFDRFRQLVAHHDVWDERNNRAYLMTPRERFVTAANLGRVYQWHYLDIGYGVTITSPNAVARMTNSLSVKMGEKVLEIGTGSGYQSAYLSNLTDRVFTIEIIKPLFGRTGGVYDKLIGEGYSEYKVITRKNADGYYGWVENAPFDKIIVTCGIDHIPPDLLQQLVPNGIMVIPVGPPGAQHVLKVVKTQQADGTFSVARSDIYNGEIVPFVPFTALDGDIIVGTHNV